MIRRCETGVKSVESLAASQFWSALDPNAGSFVYQTFDDLKSRRDRNLARTLRGSLNELWGTLARLNEQGAGVFVTINETAPL